MKEFSFYSNDEATKVSVISIAVNLGLSLAKLVAGIIGHSQAMVSDAIHSASDVLSTFVVIIGIKVSGKEADEDHPYGHERMECVAAICLAVALFLTGLGIGYSGIKILLVGDIPEVIPGRIALGAAIISIVVKEWMYHYTKTVAKRVKSDALMADAWHHRSDSMSSLGSLCGIIGARMGYPLMDPIASIVICIFIIKAAIDIFRDAIDKMVDHSCDEETQKKIENSILSVKGVKCIDDIQTRQFGARSYVDVEIGAEASLSFIEAHNIAEQVHSRIEKDFPDVKHCMVHVNPK